MENEIRNIQCECLKILDIIHNICKDNNIQYSLCGGSVVGAHLYNSCLPWDDDIDLMMTRQNYDKFLKIAQHSLPDGYSLQNFRYSNDFTTPFTKIVNNNTTIVQQDNTVSGIFVDITVYDKVPNNIVFKYETFLWKLSQIVMIGKIPNNNLKNISRNILLSTFFRNKKNYLKFFEKQIKILSPSSKYSYAELFGAFCNTTQYSANIFENYTEILFENKKYMIVQDYVSYLKTRYNRDDFIEPKEKQIAPHYKFVDFNLPYKEYIPKNNN